MTVKAAHGFVITAARVLSYADVDRNGPDLFNPARTPRVGTSVGSGSATELATYIVEKGKLLIELKVGISPRSGVRLLFLDIHT
jgi:hypothetical protein